MHEGMARQGAGSLRLACLQVPFCELRELGHHACRGAWLLIRDGNVAGPPAAVAAAGTAAVDAADSNARALLWLTVRHAPAVHQRRVVTVHLQLMGDEKGRAEAT